MRPNNFLDLPRQVVYAPRHDDKGPNVWKTLLIPRHSLNAFSEPRPGGALELVEASKSKT